jgi:hypothetical protein
MSANRMFPALILCLFASTAVSPAISYAQASDYCTQTAGSLLEACTASVQDDGATGRAVCLNVASDSARTKCLDALDDAQEEATTLCNDQHATRLAACGVLGETRYDPDISAGRFDNPLKPSKPNVYFPLRAGMHWEYRSATQVNTVDVLNETKLIAGVTCIVFKDLVYENGFLLESTNDWYVPSKDGSVWYFGEETADYETFKGDKPVKPELTSIEGSFKTGRDGAKPGIIALAVPHVGNAYYEEFALGTAEDVTEILSTNYSYGQDPTLDQGVPQEVAVRFCKADCVVTKNYSLLEPGLFAHKYYARGVGVILEVENEGEVVQLVNCNFDARCANLPKP